MIICVDKNNRAVGLGGGCRGRVLLFGVEIKRCVADLCHILATRGRFWAFAELSRSLDRDTSVLWACEVVDGLGGARVGVARRRRAGCVWLGEGVGRWAGVEAAGCWRRRLYQARELCGVACLMVCDGWSWVIGSNGVGNGGVGDKVDVCCGSFDGAREWVDVGEGAVCCWGLLGLEGKVVEVWREASAKPFDGCKFDMKRIYFARTCRAESVK